MEFLVLHQEKRGFLGKAYYEIEIRVILTSEEEAIAQKRGLLHEPILGSDISHPQLQHLPLLCGRHRISMQDLICGFTAKVGEESQKDLLLWLKDTLEERCRQFKAYLGFVDRKAPEILFTRKGERRQKTI